jgi:hypothetical protein
MRDEHGQWRGMADGELIVVATISATPGTADVYALRPEDVRAAFDTNWPLANPRCRPSRRRPIFVSLTRIIAAFQSRPARAWRSGRSGMRRLL